MSAKYKIGDSIKFTGFFEPGVTDYATVGVHFDKRLVVRGQMTGFTHCPFEVYLDNVLVPKYQAQPASALGPIMQHWLKIKQQMHNEGVGDALLAYRLGDFYEFFFQDAKDAAEILKLTLTKRNGVDMAGLPYHSASTYFNKLLLAKKRIAVVDVTETPKPGFPAERNVTQILEHGNTL